MVGVPTKSEGLVCIYMTANARAVPQLKSRRLHNLVDADFLWLEANHFVAGHLLFGRSYSFACPQRMLRARANHSHGAKQLSERFRATNLARRKGEMAIGTAAQTLTY